MKKRGKNFLITTVKHEITIIRGGRAEKNRGFCASCADNVDLVSFDAAISAMGSGSHDIVGQIEAGEIHTVETGSGQFRVCERSLEKEK